MPHREPQVGKMGLRRSSSPILIPSLRWRTLRPRGPLGADSSGGINPQSAAGAGAEMLYSPSGAQPRKGVYRTPSERRTTLRPQ